MGADIEKGRRAEHARVSNQRGFGRVGIRQHERSTAAGGAVSHRQGAAYRSQLACERELPRELVLIEVIARYLARRGEDAERNGQVKAPAFLRKIGRGQIDGDASRWKFKATV